MFRIQNNMSAMSPVAQRLLPLRFDARHSPSGGTTPPPSQLTIVGHPTERQKTGFAAMRQTNRGLASAATVAQVTESGLTNAQVVLQRLYQLAVRASSEQLSPAERHILADEAQRLYQELEEIAQSARINGIPLLNGAQQALTFQIGTGNAGSDVHLTLMDVRPETLLPGFTAEVFREPVFARSLTEIIQQAIQAVQERTDKVVAFLERLSTALEQRTTFRENEDAQRALAWTRAMILSQPTQAVAAQTTLLSQNAMALIAP